MSKFRTIESRLRANKKKALSDKQAEIRKIRSANFRITGSIKINPSQLKKGMFRA